jgi:hypothetical protein
MSKIESEKIPHEQLLHTLKDDYTKRIDEIDAFSKRLSNICVECNTEFLYGFLDITQHYLDSQKKQARYFPGWYSPDLVTSIIKQNTQAWIKTVENVDAVCTESMKNMKNNLRALSRNVILSLDNSQRIYDIYENQQQNHEREQEFKEQENQPNQIPSLLSNRT